MEHTKIFITYKEYSALSEAIDFMEANMDWCDDAVYNSLSKTMVNPIMRVFKRYRKKHYSKK